MGIIRFLLSDSIATFTEDKLSLIKISINGYSMLKVDNLTIVDYKVSLLGRDSRRNKSYPKRGLKLIPYLIRTSQDITTSTKAISPGARIS